MNGEVLSRNGEGLNMEKRRIRNKERIQCTPQYGVLFSFEILKNPYHNIEGFMKSFLTRPQEQHRFVEENFILKRRVSQRETAVTRGYFTIFIKTVK